MGGNSGIKINAGYASTKAGRQLGVAMNRVYHEGVSGIESEFDLREAPCTRCGGEARFRFLDDAKRRLEVECPACGRYVMPREEFDEAAADVAEPELL